MNFRPEHEMHQRRRGRNIGVGLLLGALIAIIFGLTYVKITSDGFRESAVEAEQ